LKFNSDTLPAHLEQQLLPAYLISGDEPLLTAEATDAVRAKARAGGFTERETHFMERGGDWNDVRASANNLSLFAERRIVEIRMPGAKPGNTGSAAIVALLESREPDRLLIINTPKLDRDAQAPVGALSSPRRWCRCGRVPHASPVGCARAAYD
jgi:DNA polymerase-3 subunit delta